jgi:tRNA 5-methylaminomethyl-2-thiouridine biosynthesis bifunctional protein
MARLRALAESDDNNGMPQTDKSFVKPPREQTVLWIGLPSEPLYLSPVLGCDFPEIFANHSVPQCWYLSLDFEHTSVRALEHGLSLLVGPFDAIVLSKSFLDRYGFAIRSFKATLLKLCHRSSVVLVEADWVRKVDGAGAVFTETEGAETEGAKTDSCEANPTGPGDEEPVAKVLGEISRIIARTVPGLPMGRTMANEPGPLVLTPGAAGRRSNLEDCLRMRWQGEANIQTRAGRLKSVAVLGAGIAGVTLALELLKRGHKVELFETDTELLSQGSRQPLLATYPQFAKDANSLSLLTQYSLQLLANSPYASRLKVPGRFQVASSSPDAINQEALVAQLGLDPGLLQFMNPTQSKCIWNRFDHEAGLSNIETTQAGERRFGGLWIALGAQLNVNSLRSHVLQLARQNPQRLNLHLGQQADLALLTQQFQTVIVATGQGTPDLLATSQDHVDILRGSSWKVYSGNSFSMSSVDTVASRAELKGPRTARPGMTKDVAILGGPVSLQRMGDSRWLMGSSYFDASAVMPTEEAQWQSLIEGARALTGNALRSIKKLAAHPGPRCSVRDRMPLIGPLPRRSPHHAQVYLATAFGSRGLLWAHLAAQLIADHIDSIFPRIGLKALKSIDPLRYAERSRSAYDDSTKISSWPI